MDNILNKKIGFIGCGHMASAIIKGILQVGLCGKENILASAAHEKTVCGINCTMDNVAVAKNSDIIILAVRPNIFEGVANQIKSSIKNDAVIVSVAAFISLDDMKKYFGSSHKLIRVMPNGPVSVGEGMSALCGDVDDDVVSIFNSCGKCEIVDEALLDAVIAVSGSSPAYVYMLIKAMSDKVQELGMSQDFALEFAAQAVLGSARVVQSLEVSPEDLIDQICTPGGTTIEAVDTLKNEGFEDAVKAAMQAAYDKSKNH